MLFDLDELAGLSQRLRLFSWNRPGIVSFHDADHGDGHDLRAWLDARLAESGIVAGGAKRVLCYPRLFGYVFNPLSEWFCYRTDGELAAVIHEVHNTYGERHAYVLRAGNDTVVRQSCVKDFYVSPFLSMDCTYDFTIHPPADDVVISIHEKELGTPILTANFSGKRRTLNDASLLAMVLRHPLMTIKVIAAIHYEAVRLMAKGVQRHAHEAAAPKLRQPLPQGQPALGD